MHIFHYHNTTAKFDPDLGFIVHVWLIRHFLFSLQQTRTDMKFRTEIETCKDCITLQPERPIVLTGSCFADNIGGAMRRCLWDAANPLGVLFNPLSIAGAIELSLLTGNASEVFKKTLFEANGLIHSWLCDSSGSACSVETAVEKFESRSAVLRRMLDRGRTLCVTFGSAFCYFLAGESDPVANCHKQPSTLFSRRRIQADEITGRWQPLLEKLRNLFPGLEVIFTVSPVRHVRDGLHENSLSKSTLLLAVDKICRENKFCYYFPAYEILMDDLRDYRFYASDLVHPSEQAVEYIWEKFKDTFIDPQGLEMLKKGEAICRRVAHRPILSTAEQHAEFRDCTRRMAEEFKKAYPESLDLLME